MSVVSQKHPPTVEETSSGGSLFRRRPSRQHVLLSLVVLLGAIFRIYDLGAESYWIDEVSLIRTATADVEQILADFWHNGRPPVYVWLGRAWIAAFGTSETATRSLSALFGVGAIGVMYMVGRQLFAPAVGLIAAFLLAVSPFQVYHSQNFRYYSLLLFVTLVSFYLYTAALRLRDLRWFVAWVAASVLLFLTHTFGLFVIGAQTLHFLLLHRTHAVLLKPWIVSQAAIYVAPTLLLLPRLWSDVVVSGHGAPGPTWIEFDSEPPQIAWLLYYTLKEYLFGGMAPLGRLSVLLATATGVVLIIYWLVRGRLVLVQSARDTIRERFGTAGRGNEVVLAVCWFVLPLALPIVLSILVRPMFVSRYTSAAAPAVYLLLALGIWGVRRMVPPLLSVSLLAALIAPGLHTYYAKPYNEQWREMVDHVNGAARKGDAVLLSPNGLTQGWEWYYEGELPECPREVGRLEIAAVLAALERCAAVHPRIWIVLRDTVFEARFNDALSEVLDTPGRSRVAFAARYDYHHTRLILVEQAPRAGEH